MTPSRKRKRGKQRRQDQRGKDFHHDTESSTDSPDDMRTMAPQHQFAHQEGLLLDVLEFLDVVTLVKNKQVSKKWMALCTTAIDNKCVNPKDFETTEELRDIVLKYCDNTPSDIEEIATVYGYPINKFRVHLLENFQFVFYNCRQFNEYIGDWDMSNAKNMHCMFMRAILFNQDLSKWNTSAVEDMTATFAFASSFNQSLNLWDMSSVTDISQMFVRATSFNQLVDSWDTSNIRIMANAFYGATSFNQSLSNWNLDSVERYHGILEDATSYNQELPDGLDAHLAIGSDTDSNSDSDDGAEW